MANEIDIRLQHAVVHWGYKWPPELSSGVMFYDGLRITIEEFKKKSKELKA